MKIISSYSDYYDCIQKNTAHIDIHTGAVLVPNIVDCFLKKTTGKRRN